MVISAEGDGDRLTVYVDPSTSWRREPYFSHLRELALSMAGKGQIVIRINSRVIVLLPGKEVDLGLCEKDDHIITRRRQDTGEWEAVRIVAKEVPAHQKGKWMRWS
jgi:hypothetical protein